MEKANVKRLNIVGAILLLIASVVATILCWTHYANDGTIQYDKPFKKDEIRPRTVSISQLLLGLVVSVLCGGIFIWFVMEKFLWVRVCGDNLRNDFAKTTDKKWLIKGADCPKLRASEESDYRYAFTFWIGLMERMLYTLALFIGFPHWIPFWIGVKVASIRRKGPAHFNMFLIGNMLSLSFGFLGAWIALGELPFFNLVGRLK